MSAWETWLGREERRADRIDAGLGCRFRATLDLGGGDGPLPQGIHWCLCPPDAPTAALDEDGHPRREEGGFLPPVPLPRRMWAGSTVTFHRALMVGAAIERVSRIAAITDKEGKGGPLVFVEIDHATMADGQLAIAERQSLVYRQAAPVDAPLSPPTATGAAFDATHWDAHREVAPDPRLLFRYSALTFNSHRIHYDWSYAQGVERYRGLVVHGPLTATLLLQLAGAQFGDNRLARFAFRGLSPAIAGEPLHLVMRGSGDELALAAFAGDGRQIVEASATLA